MVSHASSSRAIGALVDALSKWIGYTDPCQGSRPGATEWLPTNTMEQHQPYPQPVASFVDGDVPRVGVHYLPARGIPRVRGQEFCPRTRRWHPPASKCPRRRRMPPPARGAVCSSTDHDAGTADVPAGARGRHSAGGSTTSGASPGARTSARGAGSRLRLTCSRCPSSPTAS